MKHTTLVLAVSAAAFAAASTVQATAWAQAATEGQILADQASVVVVGDKIILKRVPVRVGADLSRTRLRDVTIDLTAKLNNGAINRVSIVEEGPATPLAIGFVAGRYKNIADGCEFIVEGAGVSAGGRTNWSLSTVAATCTGGFSGTWQTGPIAGHRNESVIAANECVSEGASEAYGLLGASNRYFFSTGALLRATRTQNGLVVEEIGEANSAVTCETVDGPVTLNLCPGGVCQ